MLVSRSSRAIWLALHPLDHIRGNGLLSSLAHLLGGFGRPAALQNACRPHDYALDGRDTHLVSFHDEGDLVVRRQAKMTPDLCWNSDLTLGGERRYELSARPLCRLHGNTLL